MGRHSFILGLHVTQDIDCQKEIVSMVDWYNIGKQMHKLDSDRNLEATEYWLT